LSKIPLLAVTAMVGDRERVLAAGFDDYLSKPIVAQTFVSQVEALLRHERLRLAQRQTYAGLP
jgi:two-component system cell cycle response regulator